MPYVKTTVLATFNRYLTKLDELNDLFYGHATQEDGIVHRSGNNDIVKSSINCPDNASILSPSGPWVESAGAGDAKHSGQSSAGLLNHIFAFTSSL